MSESPAPQEACREATEADVPRLAELVAAGVDELRGNKGGEMWARTEGRRPPYEPRLQEEIIDASYRVLVGDLDGVPVAYAVGRIESLADGDRLGVVTDLYVEPPARSVGLGELLMDDLVAWCAAEGCIGVDSLALPGDRATKNFFESFGLVARAILVHKRLR